MFCVLVFMACGIIDAALLHVFRKQVLLTGPGPELCGLQARNNISISSRMLRKIRPHFALIPFVYFYKPTQDLKMVVALTH